MGRCCDSLLVCEVPCKKEKKCCVEPCKKKEKKCCIELIEPCKKKKNVCCKPVKSYICKEVKEKPCTINLCCTEKPKVPKQKITYVINLPSC